LSEPETKHVFPVNLAKIRSAVPEIFEAQTNSHCAKTEPYLRAVKISADLTPCQIINAIPKIACLWYSRICAEKGR